MRLGEASEHSGLVPCLRGRIEPLEVRVEGWTLVEQLDPVAAAGADHQRLADPAPTMAHADPEWCVGADRGPHHRVGQDIRAEELTSGDHAQVVASAAAHERHRRARDTVGATHDFLLIAGQAIGEQEQHPMRPVFNATERFSGAGPSAAKVCRCPGRDPSRHAEPGAAECGHHNPGVARAAAGDLAGGGAADERRSAGRCSNAGEQGGGLVAIGGEDDQQAGVRATRQRRNHGLRTGPICIEILGAPHRHPAVIWVNGGHVLPQVRRA